MQRYLLKISIIAVSLLGFLIIPTAIATAATGCDATTTAGAIQCGSDNAAGVPQGSDSTTDINTTVRNVVDILSVVVGVVAVIMITIGGLRYITSAGDTTKVGAAKNTILYAVIGLVIVALAQIIVHFVLDKAKTATTTSRGANQYSKIAQINLP